MAGHLGGSYLRLADDIATVVQPEGIRVIPMVGRGSRQALADLVAFDDVTLAMLQSDVLDLSLSSDNAANPVDDIRYITTLGFEEFHVIAPRAVTSIFDLEGLPVSIGPSESGSAVTAIFVFSDLGIDIEPVTMSNAEAMQALEAGDIAAMTRVVAQPAPFLGAMPEDNYHFLAVPSGQIGAPYAKTTLRSANYPHLTDSDVETVAVAAVLAALFDPDDEIASNAISEFTKAFFGNIEKLKKGAHHPKWKDIEPLMDLAGWPRLPAADEALHTGLGR